MTEQETYKLSEKKKDKIQNAYSIYGSASTTRLTQLLIKDGIKITKEEVKAVLDEQEQQQLFNPPQVRRKKEHGSITALFPFECIVDGQFAKVDYALHVVT